MWPIHAIFAISIAVDPSISVAPRSFVGQSFQNIVTLLNKWLSLVIVLSQMNTNKGDVEHNRTIPRVVFGSTRIPGSRRTIKLGNFSYRGRYQ